MSPRLRALQVALLMAVVLLWRGAFGLGQYLDLDAAVYQRAAADHARHLQLGDWLREPSGAVYTALEYWPPLYPVLAGAVAALGVPVDTAARLVSFVAGWLTVLPVYLLGRRLWGHRAGLWAGAVVGFDPRLAWYGTVSRTEALYVALFCCGAAGALAPSRRGAASWLLAGACFALAFLTRFDGLTAAAAGALAMALLDRRRLLRRVGLLALGFVAVAAPYWGWLARLGDGGFVVVAPQKVLMDRLEAVWTTEGMGTLDAFVQRFGPPGLGRFDPLQVAMVPVKGTTWWISHGLQGLPHAFWLGLSATSWTLLLLAALTVARRPADRRVGALLALMLPAIPVAMGSFWDPASRYFAFWAPVAALLAAPTLARWQVPPWIAATLLPLLLCADLWVPDGRHFDIPFPLDATGAAAVGGTRWVVAIVAVAAGALLGGLRLPLVAGLGAAAAGTSCLVAMGGRFHDGGQLAALVGLSLALGVWVGARPRWPRAALAASWLAIAAMSLAAMHRADGVVGRTRWSDEVAGWLRVHPEVTSVASWNGLDVLRAGRAWVVMPPSPDGRAVGRVDAFLVPWPMPPCALATDVERGDFPLLASFQISRGGPAWRIYRVQE